MGETRQAGKDASAQGPPFPPGYKLIYRGEPLPAFYAAEMLRPLVGKTVWILDSGGRTRNGRLLEVPWVREDQQDKVPPVVFQDDRPFYLKGMVCLAAWAGIDRAEG